MPKLRESIVPCLFTFALGAVIGAMTVRAILVALILGSTVLLFLIRALRRMQYPLTVLVLFASLAFALGLVRGVAYNERFSCLEICARVGTYTELSGLVVKEPEYREASQRLTLRIDGAEHMANVLVTLPRRPAFAYGDRLRVSGVLRMPEDFVPETGATFRYVDFLHARGIILLLEGRSAVLLTRGEGNVIVHGLLRLKSKILAITDRLPAPQNGLLMGMIFGGKNGLPRSVQDDFRIAGLIHIVVLSGENLTIIALLITFLVRKFLGFIPGMLFSGVVVTAYAILGGMEPATMRALFIVVLAFFAILLKREAHLPRIVFIGAAVLLSMNPLLLFNDPSFQLSMLALIGLLSIGPLIERLLLLRGMHSSVASYLAPILGAQLGVLPYIMWSTQSFALYAIPANIFILFFIGFLSIGGIIIVMTGIALPVLFPLVALPVQAALMIVITFAHVVARLPWAAIPVHISGGMVFAFYCILATWLYARWRRRDLSPLALFTLREEVRLLAKRKIPWSPPLPEVKGIDLDIAQMVFVPTIIRHHDEELASIDWNA